MAKPINHSLLWESICWVFYQYAKLTPEEQRIRPLRAYLHEDGARVAKCIKVLRHAYRCQMRALEGQKRCSKPDFVYLKDMVMESLKLEWGWLDETRNLYSSIAATYMTWERLGQSGVSKRKLALVVTYGNLFLRPNHKIRRGVQGILL